MPAKALWKRVLMTGVAALAVAVSACGGNAAWAADASGEQGFAAVKGLPGDQRYELYANMSLSSDHGYVGKIVSDIPYAVVSEYNPADAGSVATIRVWTGVLSRENNDLYAVWDELQADSQGKISVLTLDDEVCVKDYFQAAEQTEFRKAEMLGIVPFAVDIPTDAEAANRGIEQVAEDGLYDLYGVTSDVLLTEHPDAVQALADIPQVGTMVELTEDSRHHWAEDYVYDLLSRSVIQGYEDQTIRPDATLSRAEFVAMLVRAMGLPAASGASAFKDVSDHWSKEAVAAAESAGIVVKERPNQKFLPDESITRIDMIEMVYRATLKYSISADNDESSLSFTDIGSLNEQQKAALRTIVGAGIVSGYPDGTIKPENPLNRAEAFKVISSILAMIGKR